MVIARKPLIFTREAIRRLDRLAVERFHMPSIVLMENAGASIAAAAMGLLGRSRKVAIYCGPGNNGGDGLVAARHLHNAGVEVQVIPAPGDCSGDAAINLAIVRAMRVPVVEHPTAPGLVIDALLGTGLDRPVQGKMAEQIAAINRWGVRGVQILSVDLPSGLDADTGRPLGTAVRADLTVTLCGWKAGFVRRESRKFTGRIAVGDIGVPRELMEALAVKTKSAGNDGRRKAGVGRR